MDIMNYGLREKYEQLKKFGDRLSDMKDIIKWDCMKPLLSDLLQSQDKEHKLPLSVRWEERERTDQEGEEYTPQKEPHSWAIHTHNGHS